MKKYFLWPVIWIALICLIIATPIALKADNCATLTEDLAIGMQDSTGSNQVQELQIFLYNHSYLFEQPTGYFGYATFKAVQDFQRTINIPALGTVNTVTRMAINDACSGQNFSTLRHTPIGYFDGVINGIAYGWVVDADKPTESADVDIYIDGAYGQGGTLIARVKADSPSFDVTKDYPLFTGNNRFIYSIPSKYRDGKTHTLYAYGIDSTGNANVPLSGNPRTYTATGPMSSGTASTGSASTQAISDAVARAIAQAKASAQTQVQSPTQPVTQKLSASPIPTSTTIADKDTIDVYIVAGQSNAVGLGTVSEVTDNPLYKNILQNKDRITYFSGPPSLNNASAMPLERNGKSIINGLNFGPDLGIAGSLTTLNKDFTIFKFAYPASALAPSVYQSYPALWRQRGDSSKYPASETLYDRMIKTFNRTFASDIKKGKKVVVRAVFWMQGEEDALQLDTANTYLSHLQIFGKQLRGDLPFPPESPLIIGKIAISPWPYSQIVRVADDAFAKSNSSVFVIETNDLPKIADGAHYNSTGQLNLGYRMGQQYLDYLRKISAR